MHPPETGFLTFALDGVAFQLRWPADFSWLRGYGTVFRVMDQLPSGNLCFGVDGPYGRLFIKYAGARTVNYSGRPEDAAEWLARSAELYRQFAHACLVPMLTHGPAGEGYATVFPWQDAPPLRPLPPSDRVLTQVRKLPPVHTLQMLDGVFDLHAALSAFGLVAVDFTDEHVLIDFDARRALVCDVDLYKPKPAFNTRGRMPGSPRFLAPEEYVMGDPLGEDTTVYKMGALAFEFYGDNADRGRDTWIGPEKLYAVAAKATQENRKKRYPTMREFLIDWRNAVSATRL
ncbi:MAG: serine/threonine protein kinase [Clostridia bacterium]|nr:serine/threonine protein kinase [Clostridia bacterium]